jgi:hypothetical protein
MTERFGKGQNELGIGAKYLGQTQHTPDQTGFFEECAE